ncbi:hypothetical protein [Thalassoglobus neptunius]|uniref:hypothetical protein n=1 Tax=Thalassoglobus neptunius TaxID=1938619 RepID=UPI0011B77583|nr:hypothetical protein [Thalassoglobus neptunius]
MRRNEPEQKQRYCGHPGTTPQRGRRRDRRPYSLITDLLIIMFLVSTICMTGCFLSRNHNSGLPTRYRANSEQLEIRSDAKIEKEGEIFEELVSLRDEIVELLELPPANRPVRIYLFQDEERYVQYMTTSHPELPQRRAFFIGTPTELSVYAYMGPSMMEDLRHEYTHGVLHASLRTVPLWLDEGIAEYFEIRRYDSLRRHPEHAPKLAIAVANGWEPNLRRLEQIERVSQMQRPDYQEAWAWVHYLVHECPDGRSLLADYCQSLAASNRAPGFSPLIEQQVPNAEQRLMGYVTSTLDSGRTVQVSGNR